MQAELRALASLLKYSPDQPRDDHGRFGSGSDDLDAEVANNGYEPPDTSAHPIDRRDHGEWGYSHSNSYAIAGAAAAQMGIAGYKNDPDNKAAAKLANNWLGDIAKDTVGSEETLYHSFENVRGTEWHVGDTLRVPLQASAGKPGHYGTRMDKVDQVGEPTVFEYDKGTQMIAYGKWKKDRDGDWPREFQHVYSEAIVAGGFKITGVREEGEDYFGFQHNSADKTHGPVTGKVVTLRQIETFDPKTGWRSRG